jgi:hypothetical protein
MQEARPMSQMPPVQYGSRSPDGRWWWDGQAWQPVPEAQQAAERAGQPTAPGWNPNAMAAVPPPTGSLGTPRRTGICILLAVVTFGIYTLFWTYWTQDEIKYHSGIGVGGGLGLLIYVLVSPVTYFLVASDTEALYRRRGWNPPRTTLTGLWVLLPLVGQIVWFVKVQRALNAYWQALGAPPP